MKAIWNGTVIAESDATEVVEGNHYFPHTAIKKEHFKKSEVTATLCPWKGMANYYDVVVNDKTNVGAAWYYADPKPAAANIKDHIAFWKGVDVTD